MPNYIVNANAQPNGDNELTPGSAGAQLVHATRRTRTKCTWASSPGASARSQRPGLAATRPTAATTAPTRATRASTTHDHRVLETPWRSPALRDNAPLEQVRVQTNRMASACTSECGPEAVECRAGRVVRSHAFLGQRRRRSERAAGRLGVLAVQRGMPDRVVLVRHVRLMDYANGRSAAEPRTPRSHAR